MNQQQFGEALRERRLALGKTLKELGAETGLSHRTIANIEASGGGNIVSVFKLLDALGLQLVLAETVEIEVAPED